MSRTLFEKDKLLFSFNINVKIYILKGSIIPLHFKFFLTGPTEENKFSPTNSPPWLDNTSWARITKYLFSLNKLDPLKVLGSNLSTILVNSKV